MISTQDTPKFAYLRHRPFLIIDVFCVPTKGARTERPGWLKDERAKTYREDPHIVDRVSDKHLVQASVIIDVVGDKVIKNRLSDNDDEVLSHFKSKYSDIIERGRNTWIGKTTAQYRAIEAQKRSPRQVASDGHHKAAHTPDAFQAVSRKV